MLQTRAVRGGGDVQVADVREAGGASVTFRAVQGRVDLDEAEGASAVVDREAGAALPHGPFDREVLARLGARQVGHPGQEDHLGVPDMAESRVRVDRADVRPVAGRPWTTGAGSAPSANPARTFQPASRARQARISRSAASRAAGRTPADGRRTSRSRRRPGRTRRPRRRRGSAAGGHRRRPVRARRSATSVARSATQGSVTISPGCRSSSLSTVFTETETPGTTAATCALTRSVAGRGRRGGRGALGARAWGVPPGRVKESEAAMRCGTGPRIRSATAPHQRISRRMAGCGSRA
ncbi:hypothetical protein SANTM175S_00945 [Streptomyces antimycoticus]